jgi:FKBP-type peptidyl-prolyl cis-trans isomerase 2
MATLSLPSSEFKGEHKMQTAQPGDRVQVHYLKRLENGCTASSRGGAPLEIAVGEGHPLLPGLGLALVGLAPGSSTTVRVPPELAYGAVDAGRVHYWSRSRFPKDQLLPVGQRVRVLDRQGRRGSVRIVEVLGKKVVVDTNHRYAGQALELEVELVGILSAATASPPPPQS